MDAFDDRVRQTERSDFDDLVALWRRVWAATYTATLGEETVEAMLRELDGHGAGMLIPDHARGLCAVRDGAILGTAVHSVQGPIVYLWAMYVLPEHQRQGVGSRLLRAVRQASGPRPIEIRVLSSSIQATAFYREHGFVAVGQETTPIIGAVAELCTVMRKTGRTDP